MLVASNGGMPFPPTCENLSNLFGYFKAMRTRHAKLRYFDWDGQVHLAKCKNGGQQGDPLELIFCLTIHHLWGLVLTRFPESRTIVYPCDDHIKTSLSVVFKVLDELKRVLKEDPGLDLT